MNSPGCGQQKFKCHNAVGRCRSSRYVPKSLGIHFDNRVNPAQINLQISDDHDKCCFDRGAPKEMPTVFSTPWRGKKTLSSLGWQTISDN